MSHDDHDAQHAFEKKALRNVRGLLDNLEKSERTQGKNTAKLFLLSVAAIVGTLYVPYWIALMFTPSPTKEDLQREEERRKGAHIAFQESSASYRLNPRKAFVDGPAEPRYENYAGACVARISRLANTQHRKEIAGMEGRAKVT